MNDVKINLESYQRPSQELQRKLELLQSYSQVNIIGPMLQSVPSQWDVSKDFFIQVDSYQLGNATNSVILGDADSVKSEHKQFFDYIFPRQKNFTDFEALLEFLTRYPKLKSLHLYGFWGGRFDHKHLIPCQISDFLLHNPQITMALLYNESHQPGPVVLTQGIHHFNEQISFSIISPYPQQIHLMGDASYKGQLNLPAWSGLGLSNRSFGCWSMECQLPIWKYILSNDEHNDQDIKK